MLVIWWVIHNVSLLDSCTTRVQRSRQLTTGDTLTGVAWNRSCMGKCTTGSEWLGPHTPIRKCRSFRVSCTCGTITKPWAHEQTTISNGGLPHHHPNVFLFIAVLRTIAKADKVKRGQIDSGVAPPSWKRVCRDIEHRIQRSAAPGTQDSSSLLRCCWTAP